ncbi:MAG TPA: SDR family oxidoreductase [Thermoanaerobaculia bacterium]|nr:SDR family oxidoreductase [Thermoanaerobaculia bacterium]
MTRTGVALDGKVALVTGASRGIGRAIAERLAEDGAVVVVHYGSNAAAADDTVRSIESAGGKAFAAAADLSSLEQIQSLFERVDSELDSRMGTNALDILVNNAGRSSPAHYQQLTPQQFDHLFAVNVRGAFRVTQLALTRMREGGRIINISSVASRRATLSPIAVPYGMTKAALDAFTLGLAQDLGRRKITVNTIAPGVVQTDINAEALRPPEVRKMLEGQTALGRLGEATDIAGVAAFLASEESRWVTGQYIEVSGGLRL